MPSLGRILLWIFSLLILLNFSISDTSAQQYACNNGICPIRFGNGWYTNLCGVGTYASVNPALANVNNGSCKHCNSDNGSCSTQYPTDWIYTFACPGYHTSCNTLVNSFQGPATRAFQIQNAQPNTTYQIDVFSQDCFFGGSGWSCPTTLYPGGNLKSYMVWYSGSGTPQAAPNICKTAGLSCTGYDDYCCSGLSCSPSTGTCYSPSGGSGPSCLPNGSSCTGTPCCSGYCGSGICSNPPTTTRYGCSGTACVVMQNGPYTVGNCNNACVPPPTPPPPPQPFPINGNPNCSGGANIALSWNPIGGAAFYNVSRSTSPSSGQTFIGQTPTTNYTNNTNLVAGTTYYYVVSAHNSSGGYILGSNPTPFTAPTCGGGPTPPPTPGPGLTALQGFVILDSNGNGQVLGDGDTTGIDGVTVTLSGSSNASMQSGSCNSLTGPGSYCFSNLSQAGTYTLTITTPSGYTGTYPNANGSWNNITYNPNNASGRYDFGIRSTAPPGQFTQQTPVTACNSNLPYVDLTWSASLNATNYDVLRSGDSVNFSTIASNLSPATLSYRDSNVSPALGYYYRIQARNSFGSSLSNDTYIVSSNCTTPITNLSCAGSPPDGSTSPATTFTWSASFNGGLAGTHIYDWSGTDDLDLKTTNPTSLSYTTAGTKYGSIFVYSGNAQSGFQSNSANCGTVNVSAPAVPPTVDLNGPSTINNGSTATLTWNTAGSDPSSCTGSSTQDPSWNGDKNVAGGTHDTPALNNPPTASYTYNITCSKAGFPDATDSVTVNVTSNAPPFIQTEGGDVHTNTGITN